MSAPYVSLAVPPRSFIGDKNEILYAMSDLCQSEIKALYFSHKHSMIERRICLFVLSTQNWSRSGARKRHKLVKENVSIDGGVEPYAVHVRL